VRNRLEAALMGQKRQRAPTPFLVDATPSLAPDRSIYSMKSTQ
jgi:hypothetical protein